jgi:DNA processing protein
MQIKKLTLTSNEFPHQLRTIPGPPQELFTQGEPLAGLLKRPCVAIVGSRNATPYGKRVTEQIASELARYGVVIVSGLALGIDCVAHQAALNAGGHAIAVLPGPLDKIHPSTNRPLAEEIITSGGTLLSEYGTTSTIYKQNFIARNRLVAGLSQALLIPEAAEKSGSLHTARFALEQGKEVLAVPGNIDSTTSVGTNNLIKSGATPVTSAADVLHGLGLTIVKAQKREVRGRNHHEQSLLDLMSAGIHAGEELLKQSGLNVREFNQALTMLEIGGKIRPLGANQWSLI